MAITSATSGAARWGPARLTAGGGATPTTRAEWGAVPAGIGGRRLVGAAKCAMRASSGWIGTYGGAEADTSATSGACGDRTATRARRPGSNDRFGRKDGRPTLGLSGV